VFISRNRIFLFKLLGKICEHLFTIFKTVFMKKVIFFAFLSVFLTQCKQEKQLVVDEYSLTDAQIDLKTNLNLPEKTANYARKLPDWMTALGMPTPQTDAEKATIGRVLFYDKNLSANRAVSCASCHKQALGFGDNVAFSDGVNGKTLRNSPPLTNVPTVSGYYSMIEGKKPNFFWDQRVETVERQSEETLENVIEMGISADIAASRVFEKKYYQPLWQKTFGHFQPTKGEVLACLAEFVKAMGAENARFDQGMIEAAGDINAFDSALVTQVVSTGYYSVTQVNVLTTFFPKMNVEESLGKDIFIKNCTKCHSPVRNFQENFEACNGLDVTYADAGKGKRTLNPADNGVFKSPSLKNIFKTAPYMHDGRFKTLAEVISFYSEGIQKHPNLHPLLKNANGTPKNLQLSAAEKNNLLQFLNTLTDDGSLADVRFSNPFK
jgi:cytochrome c peroxidase